MNWMTIMSHWWAYFLYKTLPNSWEVEDFDQMMVVKQNNKHSGLITWNSQSCLIEQWYVWFNHVYIFLSIPLQATHPGLRDLVRDIARLNQTLFLNRDSKYSEIQKGLLFLSHTMYSLKPWITANSKTPLINLQRHLLKSPHETLHLPKH